MRNAIPGLTILVVKPDGVRWAGAFGLADIASRKSASEHTAGYRVRQISILRPWSFAVIRQSVPNRGDPGTKPLLENQARER